MLRQKHYHGRKLKWKSFRNGEEVYVYFPRRKQGTFPKFTSYWQGPFRVIRKMSDLTYLVNCGTRGKKQVIHVDRMKKKYPQVLTGECQPYSQKDEWSSDSEAEHVDKSDTNGHNSDRPLRNRKMPHWLNYGV